MEGVHILVFPFPAQGHFLPLLDLTHQLCLRSKYNLTVTVLTTPKNLTLLDPLLSLHPNIKTLLLPLPPHPQLPPGVENVRDIGNHGNVPIIAALSQLQDPIIRWFRSHPHPPLAIISDFFLGWTVRLAHLLRIPRFCFFSSGAFLACVIGTLWADPTVSPPAVDFPHLPNSPSFDWDHLPSAFRRYRESVPDMQFIREGMVANSDSSGAVFNSFDALEREYFRHLSSEIGPRRVYAVGPLSLIGVPEAEAETSGLEVLEWLNGCPDESVVYACFGSQKLLNRRQMEALAAGLERSGTRFVWVVKTGSERDLENGFGVIPDGFEERVVGLGQGLVVKKWAPQVQILSHRAVGGFLSHCGWNSTLEAIVGGVMLLAWPMEADQFVNARLLVDDMGAAVKVCEGADAVPDSAELGKAIAESMTSAAPQRLKAKKLREMAFEALREGGSSTEDLDEFVRDLGQLKN